MLCHPLLPAQSFPASGSFPVSHSSHQVAKVLEFQLQRQSFQWTPRTDLLWDGLVGSPCSPRDSQESPPTLQFKTINSLALGFLDSPTLTSIHDYWKNHSLVIKPVKSLPFLSFLFSFLPTPHVRFIFLEIPFKCLFLIPLFSSPASQISPYDSIMFYSTNSLSSHTYQSLKNPSILPLWCLFVTTFSFSSAFFFKRFKSGIVSWDLA